MQELCARLPKGQGSRQRLIHLKLEIGESFAALIPEQNLATADELFIDPQPILIRAGFRAGAPRAGLQAHADRSLKDVGAKRAPVHVEFDAQVASVANPGNLVAGIEYDDFGENTNQNRAFSHAQSLQLTVES